MISTKREYTLIVKKKLMNPLYMQNNTKKKT